MVIPVPPKKYPIDQKGFFHMAPKDTEAQVGLTAPEDTKRGYGLWRGEVIHPADPRMDEILASGDPITDTKGLGLRYTPVRGSYAVQHFRVNDPDKFSAALDVAFPDVHDAVVRLVAEDIRERGFAALKDWCVSSALPEPFEVWEVRTEMRCDGYRPDICVRHPEGGQIELEVVNTHAPESDRLEKAWGAGHIVLSMRIRDVVEKIVFSAGRGVVPEDDELRALLKGRRFTLCGRSEVSEEVRAVWRDLNLAAYCEDLSHELKRAWRVYHYRLSETAVMLGGGTRSAVDCEDAKERCEYAYDLIYRRCDGRVSGFLQGWYRPLLESLRLAFAPDENFLAKLSVAESFLSNFEQARDSDAAGKAAKRLRYRIAAMQRQKKGCAEHVWENASSHAESNAERFGWNGWIKRNLGHENMPSFMRSLKGDE